LIPAAGHDDPAGAMASMGLPAARRHLLSHTATMVAVVASIIGGAFVALAAGTLGAGRLPVVASAAVGVLVALARPPCSGATRRDAGTRRAGRPAAVPIPNRAERRHATSQAT
jgi:hypothetical protein